MGFIYNLPFFLGELFSIDPKYHGHPSISSLKLLQVVLVVWCSFLTLEFHDCIGPLKKQKIS